MLEAGLGRAQEGMASPGGAARWPWAWDVALRVCVLASGTGYVAPSLLLVKASSLSPAGQLADVTSLKM